MRAQVVTGCVIVLGCLLGATAARAERVTLLPVSGLNVHEDTLVAAQDLLKGELTKTGRYQVWVVAGEVGRHEIAPDAAVEMTRAHGGELGVVLHVTRLGNTARLRLTAYHAATGQMVWIDELAAATPDDMPPVLTRLAQGMATGRRAADSGDIETVTEKEAAAHRKRTATNVFGLQLGYLLPLRAAHEGEQLALPGLAIFWLYDARTFLADIAMGFHTDGDEGDFWIGLGAYVPFQRTDFTPYLGGGLRYAFSQYGGDGGSGMVALLSGGLLLGRLSTVQLRGELSYFFNLFAEEHQPLLGGTTTDSTRAHGITVSLGIGF
jgi:hypothetical protein